jgi:hypothetical protein
MPSLWRIPESNIFVNPQRVVTIEQGTNEVNICIDEGDIRRFLHIPAANLTAVVDSYNNSQSR